MDPYTESTQQWLNKRFSAVDKSGVYIAHQPIYGFRAGHCERSPGQRYAITWQIVRALTHLRFKSLVDIGGAEGYKAALVRDIFGVKVSSCDLSETAVHRAKAIFNVDGEAVDIHALPFADEQFDIVLCSETLEHVSLIEDATRELLRVARRAVIVTVPREPAEVVERNIREKVPHGHIHALDTDSFDFTIPTAKRIVVRRLHNASLRPAFGLIDAEPKDGKRSGLPQSIVRAYNKICLPLALRFVGPGSVAALVRLDGFAASMLSHYGDMLFVLIKDVQAWADKPLVRVSPRQVIDYHVPLHYPNKESQPLE